MKKNLIILSAIAGLVLISGITLSQSNEQLKKTFTDLNKKMLEMGMSDNFDGVRQFYMDDVLSLPNYEPILRGYSQILASHKKMKESGAKINDMQLVTTDVISEGNMAVEVGTFTINMTMPGMGEIKDFGKYITVWKKQKDGSWKVAIETWNTDQNPMTMMGGKEGGEGPSIKSEPKPTTNPSEPGGEEIKSSETSKPRSTQVVNTTGNSVILKSGQSNDQGQKPQTTTTSGDKEKK